MSVTSPDGDTCIVQFDQPVLWDGGSGTFAVPDSTGGGQWASQLAPDTLQTGGTQGVAHNAWQWEGPDPSITPTPDPSQSGTVS